MTYFSSEMVLYRYLRATILRKKTSLRICCGLLLFLFAACSEQNETFPTRTPVPTWTPTVLAQAAEAQMPATETSLPEALTPEAVAATNTPVVEVATNTPTPAAVDIATPEPTATLSFGLDLETAEKFPTESLAPNMVRVYVYVYDKVDFGLPGYKLNVMHNGKQLAVDAVSEPGVPGVTRTEPSPYTRFTNMNAVFVEAQAGRWEIQLLDPSGNPAAPAAAFDLTADEVTRELYVRYLLK